MTSKQKLLLNIKNEIIDIHHRFCLGYANRDELIRRLSDAGRRANELADGIYTQLDRRNYNTALRGRLNTIATAARNVAELIAAATTAADAGNDEALSRAIREIGYQVWQVIKWYGM